MLTSQTLGAVLREVRSCKVGCARISHAFGHSLQSPLTLLTSLQGLAMQLVPEVYQVGQTSIVTLGFLLEFSSSSIPHQHPLGVNRLTLGFQFATHARPITALWPAIDQPFA